MGCPLFRCDRVSCAAVDEEVTPTVYQRERFCRGDEYAHCPTLRAMLRLRRPLREDEYLEEWLAPATAKSG